LLVLAACGRDPRAQADTVGSHDSAAGDVSYTRRISQLANGASSATGKQFASASDSTKPQSDSTKEEPLTVKVAPGRPKKDSLALIAALRAGMKTPGWPVKLPEPADGAVIPEKRIVAFYGNPLSKKMGVLGALPPNLMLAKLDEVAKDWQKADPETPVQPALHLIAVVAQGGPGGDGKYRLRMDSSLIEQVYGWAQQKGWLLFLDIQTGQSTVMEELPPLMKFLERPNVHLGIDPEFHMHYEKEGVQPGKKIGTLSSKEVNYAVAQLANLVATKKLPPKVLVVHRFTRPMLKGYDRIKLDPRVQVVVDMDGWGQPWLKLDSYKAYVVSEPVQFTGFKLFYGNDTKKGDKLLTPMELLQLKPRPIYIQYQ
jgi:hypothetical protein